VTEAKGEQTTPQVGGPVFVYADRRREPITSDSTRDWNIYAETPGDCVGPTDMGWRDMFADVRTAGDASAMRFTTDAEGNSYVVWEKSAGSDDSQDVYIQKLDVDGVPRWENSGIKLNTTNFASHPDVTISDSIGGAQVTWHQVDAQGNDRIWYAKLSPKGAFTFHHCIDSNNTGIKPFIVYTPNTPYNPSGSVARPAYIAHLKPGSTATEPGLWAGTTNLIAPRFQPINIVPLNLNLGDLRLASSVSGEVYMVAWETTYPNARLMTAWTYRNVQGQTATTWVTNSIQDIRGRMWLRIKRWRDLQGWGNGILRRYWKWNQSLWHTHASEHPVSFGTIYTDERW
jgi:hypothetical protein